MGVAVADTGGALLVISQFTLYGDTTRGRRPSWIEAARPEQAEPLIERFVQSLRAAGRRSRPDGSAPTWRSNWSTTGRSPSWLEI